MRRPAGELLTTVPTEPGVRLSALLNHALARCRHVRVLGEHIRLQVMSRHVVPLAVKLSAACVSAARIIQTAVMTLPMQIEA